MREITSLDIIYGIAMITISILFILLYIPVIMEFSTRVDSKNVTSFRLMLFHSFSDIVQLFCHAATGVLLLIGFEQDHVLFRIVGTCLGTAWFLMLILIMTLTTQRLFLVVFENFSRVLLRPKAAWILTLTNCFLASIVLVLNLTPLSGMHYEIEWHYWTWDEGRPLTVVFHFIEKYLQLVSSVSSLSMYLVIFGYIYLKQQKNLNRNEQRIAVQMFSYSLFTLFVCFVWLYGEKMVPFIPFLRFFIDLLWPLWNGANAILYLIFNRTAMHVLTSMDILYGCSMSIISCIFLLLYIPVVLGFSAKVDSTSATFTFRLMIYHSIADILQLSCHLVTGALLFSGIDQDHFAFRIIGAILAGSWFSMLTLTVILTVHRLILVVFDRFSKALMCPAVTWGITIFNFCLWAIVFALNLSTYSGFYYDFEEHYWEWDMERSLGVFFDFVDSWLMLFSCVTGLLMYGIMFAHIFWKRQKRLHRNEQRIALQMFSYCIFTLIVCILWDFVEPLFLGYPIVRYCMDLLWPVWNGANAVLYLVFNRSLRKSLQTIMRAQHSAKSTWANT